MRTYGSFDDIQRATVLHFIHVNFPEMVEADGPVFPSGWSQGKHNYTRSLAAAPRSQLPALRCIPMENAQNAQNALPQEIQEFLSKQHDGERIRVFLEEIFRGWFNLVWGFKRMLFSMLEVYKLHDRYSLLSTRQLFKSDILLRVCIFSLPYH